MQLSSSRGSVSVAESWRSFYDETGVPSAVESGALVWVTDTRAPGRMDQWSLVTPNRSGRPFAT